MVIRCANLLFRPHQREITLAALSGKDVYVQAATSFGKSLCFQLPAVIDRGSMPTPPSLLYISICTHTNVICSHNCYLTPTKSHGTPTHVIPHVVMCLTALR